MDAFEEAKLRVAAKMAEEQKEREHESELLRSRKEACKRRAEQCEQAMVRAGFKPDPIYELTYGETVYHKRVATRLILEAYTFSVIRPSDDWRSPSLCIIINGKVFVADRGESVSRGFFKTSRTPVIGFLQGKERHEWEIYGNGAEELTEAAIRAQLSGRTSEPLVFESDGFYHREF